MQDGFDRPARSPRPRRCAAQLRAVEPPVVVEDAAAERVTSAASAGWPGSTTSRAIRSVSSTVAPRAAKRSATVDLPLAMPPVRPMRSMRVQPRPAKPR